MTTRSLIMSNTYAVTWHEGLELSEMEERCCSPGQILKVGRQDEIREITRRAIHSIVRGKLAMISHANGDELWIRALAEIICECEQGGRKC